MNEPSGREKQLGGFDGLEAIQVNVYAPARGLAALQCDAVVSAEVRGRIRFGSPTGCGPLLAFDEWLQS